MGQDPWWEWIRLSLEEPYAYPKRLEPGSIIHAPGALQTIFYKLIELHGHHLTSLEGRIVPVYQSRYAIVNHQYPDGRYEVFFLTTFGKAEDPNNLNPVGRFFAIPLHPPMHKSPDMPPLKLESEWFFKPQDPPFVFGVPAVVSKYDYPKGAPIRLAKGELDRLNANVELRMQRFPCIQGQLRRAYFNWKIDTVKARREIRSSSPRMLMPPLRTVVRIPPRKQDVDGRWGLRSLRPRELHSRLPFLNNFSMHSQKAVLKDFRLNLQTLPKPYYSPKLRVGASLIARIVR